MDEERLLHATEDVNQMTCTNLNFVDYSQERGHPTSLLPVVCENGMTADELNAPVTRLLDRITSTQSIPKTPPYHMTAEAFLNDFNSHFKQEEEDDVEYYTPDDMLKAMVPGQQGLVQNVKKLIRQHDFPLFDLTKLTDSYCEAKPCRAPFFLKCQQQPGPMLPKLRSPRTYRITPEMFTNKVLAKKYLQDLKLSLDQEESKQCLVCDAVNYYDNGYKQKQKKKFSVLGIPYIHGTFYKNATNHVLLFNKEDSLFTNVTIHQKGEGMGYYLTYKDKIYE